ncbi:hypothetical protein BASA81_010048 [Batrachochytrium salamandrivorans]|nr:hypothetical protein BASA81_010048 [Batrachochytrium salamandrivorans]
MPDSSYSWRSTGRRRMEPPIYTGATTFMVLARRVKALGDALVVPGESTFRNRCPSPKLERRHVFHQAALERHDLGHGGHEPLHFILLHRGGVISCGLHFAAPIYVAREHKCKSHQQGKCTNAMDRHELPGQATSYIPTSVEGVAIYGKGYSQVLEVSLKPGVLLSTQPGRMLHYDEALQVDTSELRLNFFNPTSQPRTVALASNTPGVIIPVDLSQSESFVFKLGSFLAAYGLEWDVNVRPPPPVHVLCYPRKKLIMIEIKGNGIAFFVACGSVVEKNLQYGERMIVNIESVVGFDSAIKQRIRRLGTSCTTCLCSGQGQAVSEFTGPGRLYIQSMPVEKLRRMAGNKKHGEGGNGGGGGDGDGGDGGGDGGGGGGD